MSSIYETGHAKNVANLLKFNQLIATFGTTYNPSNTTITAASLGTLYTTANTSLTNVNAVYNTWKNATNNHEIAFLPLDKLSTQLLGALQATSAPQQTINDMIYLVRKIRGHAKLTKADAGKVANHDANPIALPDPDPSANISVSISNSQQSYDQKLQHFAKLILLLQSGLVQCGLLKHKTVFTLKCLLKVRMFFSEGKLKCAFSAQLVRPNDDRQNPHCTIAPC